MRLTRSALLTLLAATGLAAAACGDDDDPVAPGTTYRATLNGANERPTPVTTAATGTASRRLNGDTIEYTVQLSNINAVTMSHIHRGTAAEAGPIMVDLFTGPVTGANFSGVLASGRITRASTFRAGFTFDSVATRLQNGSAYVNVHTTANPAGEIRGQTVRP
jgi:hypothetical protein